MTGPPGPTWQCVLVAWGDKYPVAEINHLIARVRALAAILPRFVLLSDRQRPGLDPAVVLRDIPAFWLQPAFLRGGCQAKLALFEPGTVPSDLPAVYLDLDTVVLGDVHRFIALLDRPDRIAMLQSALVPFGMFGRLLWRLSGGRRYARGNSSVLVWHPASGAAVAEAFRECLTRHPDLGFKPMYADERFISWAAQPRMRAVPSSLAVKFPTEFMMRHAWMVHLRARLPWTARRRSGLVAVTLPGAEVKAQVLVALPEGARLLDRKRRMLIWSDAALGPIRRRIIDYFAPIYPASDGSTINPKPTTP